MKTVQLFLWLFTLLVSSSVWALPNGKILDETYPFAPVRSNEILTTGDSIYGTLLYDETRPVFVIGGFSIGKPANIVTSKVPKYSNGKDVSLIICAGAFAEDYYYVYTYYPGSFQDSPEEFARINWKTNLYERIANWEKKTTMFSDMTYDYTTKTMYALEDVTPSKLLKLDLSNGNITSEITMDERFVTLACNLSGEMYAVAHDGMLYKIDKSTGKKQKIGDTGVKSIKTKQSMDFNRADGTLYWASMTYKDGVSPEGVLFVIDTYTGKATSKGQIGSNSRLSGLHVDFKLPEAGIPNKVSELKAVTAEGKAPVILTWKNPSENFGGIVLTDLTAIDIYRNDKKVYSIPSPAINMQGSWTDANPAEGINTYRLVPVNSTGQGLSLSVTCFVGIDLPKAVSDVKIENVATGTKLTWDILQSLEGINEGWINQPTLVYDIIRLPDNVVVATDLKTNSFTDDKLPEGNIYSYEIRSRTADGKGASVLSPEIKAGKSYNPPYFCSFFELNEFKMWDVIDANADDRTWTWSLYNSVDRPVCYASLTKKPSDDWLISYPIKLRSGIPYKLKFHLDSRYGGEKLEIRIGKGNTIEAQNTVISTIKTVQDVQTLEFKLPDNLDTGEYNLSFHSCAEIVTRGAFAINNVLLSIDAPSTISGTVKDEKGQIISGAKVTLKNSAGLPKETTADANGKYTILNVEVSTHTLLAEKFGYQLFSQEIEATGVDKVHNITLCFLPKYSVSGILKDINGVPLSGAKVSIAGYDSYQTTTQENGSFKISGIYQANGYKLSISKERMATYTSEINIEKDLTLDEIFMKDRPLMPYNVIAKAETNGMKVAWESPKTPQIYRYDSGKINEGLGYNGGSLVTVLGSIHETPSILENMSWYTIKGLTEHKTVNVFVFDLDESGMPDTVLYSKLYVPNTDDQWSNYTFPEPVFCPNGFMIALSYSGYLNLAKDTGTDNDYPYQERRNCFAVNFHEKVYSFMEDDPNIVKGNFLIRAEGTPLPQSGKAKSPVSTSIPSYEVWRMKAGDEKEPEKWTLRTGTSISELTFTDNEWNNLEQGYYRYAVKTLFPAEVVSAPNFSNVVGKDMSTKVTIRMKTNTPVNRTEGAKIELSSDKNKYNSVVGTNGTVKLEIDKGVYNLKIELEGYKTVSISGLDFSKEKEYTTIEYELIERVITPYHLEVSPGNLPAERIFKWNRTVNVSDDFEEHEDFAINSSGTSGWDYIDGDGLNTYGLSGFQFPNAQKKMAYMVFNPTQTEPVMNVVMNAYSGKKYLVAFACPQGANNDLLISPELLFPIDFTLSFYAKTGDPSSGLESIRVGYSLSGKNEQDFIWITGEVNIPSTWAKFKYTIPADAKYVTVNCISNDKLMFMLDDIFIGLDKEFEQPKSSAVYEVYLDGKKIGDTKKWEYKLSDLSSGNHTAGVKAVYDSGTTEMVNINFYVDPSSIGSEVSDAIIVYPNPVKDRLYIKGEYNSIEIYDASGNLIISQKTADYVNVLSLVNGVYYAKIISKNTSAIHKVLISK